MSRLRTLVVVACCVATTSLGHAATLDDLERQIRDVVTQRQTSERERARLSQEAAALAEVISASQAQLGTRVRAGAVLERQLRDFDRLAGRLDSVDRAIKGYDASIARLQGAVGAEIDKLAKALSGTDARTSAVRAAELEAVRRRIDDLVAPPAAFRTLLVVRPAATDTVADLDQKLAVLTAEQARGTEAVNALDREVAVLDGRTIVTRTLLDDLDATARTAPQDLRLVQRQVGEMQTRLRELDVKRRDLRRVRDAVVTGLADLEQQARECRARRAALIKG
jgi:chromosome segregation ATPase